MLLLAKIKQLIYNQAGVCMFGMEPPPPGCIESQPPNFQGFSSGRTHDVFNVLFLCGLMICIALLTVVFSAVSSIASVN